MLCKSYFNKKMGYCSVYSYSLVVILILSFDIVILSQVPGRKSLAPQVIFSKIRQESFTRWLVGREGARAEGL